jgi:hypothetical protein
MTRQGGQAMGQAAAYYSPLVSGSRGAINQTLAPERASITDIYRGASKSLDRAGVRGGSRDLAEAELARDRAGKLSTLAPAARMGAAEALGGLGATQTQAGLQTTGQGVGAKSAGMQGLSSIYGPQANRAWLEAQNAQETNKGMGGMIFDALKAGSGKKGGKVVPTGGAPTLGGFAPYAPTVPMNRPY